MERKQGEFIKFVEVGEELHGIVGLLIHFYSTSHSMSLLEAFPTTAMTLRRSLHAEALQATASEGFAQGPYIAARAGFEPTTLPMRHHTHKCNIMQYASLAWGDGRPCLTVPAPILDKVKTLTIVVTKQRRLTKTSQPTIAFLVAIFSPEFSNNLRPPCVSNLTSPLYVERRYINLRFEFQLQRPPP